MSTEIASSQGQVNACAKQVALFLADYGAHLLGSGATCLRLEQNINRMARALGKQVEMTIMPRHLHLTVTDLAHGNTFTTISTVGPMPVSFNVITRLSALSWSLADGRIGFCEARGDFRKIITEDNQNPWLTLGLLAAANASFCRLFGGDGAAMIIVAIATLVGFLLKNVLLGRGLDVRVTVMVCAFVSAVIGATDYLFSIGTTPGLSVGTSILYLVPGIPFLNSFSDLINRHYICAYCRLLDAVVLTCCLSTGLCLAMLLMRVEMF